VSADSLSTICIACSIFRGELQTLQERGELVDLPVRYLPSMLHMDPAKLARRLGALLEEEHRSPRKVLLLYGDCCPDMHLHEALPEVARTEGINCPEILLGRERYRSLRKEGVFFLMPEWALRWKEIFQDELGLTAEVAHDFMGEMHTRLLYLDTGIMPVPETDLQRISEFTGLPWETMAVEPDHLKDALLSKLEELNDAD